MENNFLEGICKAYVPLTLPQAKYKAILFLVDEMPIKVKPKLKVMRLSVDRAPK